MKFADLLTTTIQHSEIPLRFEPGAEESIIGPVIELVEAWLDAHRPAAPRSDFDRGQQELIAQLLDELHGLKDVPGE